MIPKELLAALRVIEIHTARLANEQLSGTYSSSFKGQGLAFREVRPYQPGDDVRTIDWNVSARMNETFVKVFVEEREMTVMLVVDLSASERFGTRRAAEGARRERGRRAARVQRDPQQRPRRPHHRDRPGRAHRRPQEGREARDARRARDPRLRAPAARGKTRRRARGARRPGPRCARRGDQPEGGARGARARVAPASIAFIVSDFYDTGYERTLALASAKHDVVPVVLVDPRDAELPDVGLASFEDLESGESIVVDTSDAAGPRVVRGRDGEDRREPRGRSFNKLGLDSVEIETGGSFVRPLRDLFARRARRIRR